jgi:L-lactate utilization protein LutB
MNNPVDMYWLKRMNDLQQSLEKNGFDVYKAENMEEAHDLVKDELIPSLGAKSVSWGGSMTFTGTKLYDDLKESEDMEVIDTFDKKVTPDEKLERRRQSLLVDLFITGTNAVTEEGHLVNLDMIGNRIAALTFGPKNVIILVGRNKIVANRDAAMAKVKNYTASVNAMRLDMKTPCVKTSYCIDCDSPQRICNTWTITEKSFPKGRVKVVLINESAGI